MKGTSIKKKQAQLYEDEVRKSRGKTVIGTEKNTKDNKEMFKLQGKLEERGALPQYKSRTDDAEKVKELTLLAFQLQSSSKQN